MSSRFSSKWFLGLGLSLAGTAAVMALFVISVPRADLPDTLPEFLSLENQSRPAAAEENRRESGESRVEATPPANIEIYESPAPSRAAQSRDAEILFNRSAPIGDREQAALRLAHEYPEEAHELLIRLLDNDDEDERLKAVAARALGKTRAGEAEGASLARHENPTVARGAVRGIASRGNEADTQTLADLLFDEQVDDTVRMEAGLGLAGMNSPEAVSALLEATHSVVDSDPSEPVFNDVLRGIVRHHFDEAGDFINGMLDHPDIESESKVAAIDEMGGLEDAGSLASLLQQARQSDPAVREAAIWAIAGRDDAGQAGNELMAILSSEETPWVRASLYEALRAGDQPDMAAVWEQTTAETDLPTRLAGFNLVAGHLPEHQVQRFDSEVVPELREIAMEDASITNRLNAIVALGRASDSQEATAVLQNLRNANVDPETQRAAEMALRRRQNGS